MAAVIDVSVDRPLMELAVRGEVAAAVHPE